MKILHATPNSNKRIRTLPITGNYLVRQTSGMLLWAEPNDSWRIFSPTGNQQILVSNIRFDDTDHSPDLWIYTAVKDSDEQLDHERMEAHHDDLLANNRIHLDRSRKWYIRQFVEMPERIGVKRFAGLPLNAWRAMWRRTIPMTDIDIYGLANKQMKILYAGMNFNTFVKWPEMQTDMNSSDTGMVQDGTQWRRSQKVMPWLQANCQGGIIPFSDYDTMFPDDQDEMTYLIDVA